MNSVARKWQVMVACLGIVVLMASSADARVKRQSSDRQSKDYTQRGFQLYAGFGGQGYEIEDRAYSFLEERESEGLFFLGAAYGLDRDLALYVEGAGSEHNTPIGDVDFGYLHVGMKYAFKTGPRNLWQPYGKASVGAMFMHEKYNEQFAAHYDDQDNGYFGPSLGLGVGIDRFISRRTAIFGELGFLFGKFDHRVIDGQDYNLSDEIGVSSGRIQFGLRIRL